MDDIHNENNAVDHHHPYQHSHSVILPVPGPGSVPPDLHNAPVHQHPHPGPLACRSPAEAP